MDALEEHHATAAIARREVFAALVELDRGDDVGCERRGGSGRGQRADRIGRGEKRATRRHGASRITSLPGGRGGTAFGRTRARTILDLLAGSSLAEHLAEVPLELPEGLVRERHRLRAARVRADPRPGQNPVPGPTRDPADRRPWRASRRRCRAEIRRRTTRARLETRGVRSTCAWVIRGWDSRRVVAARAVDRHASRVSRRSAMTRKSRTGGEKLTAANHSHNRRDRA